MTQIIFIEKQAGWRKLLRLFCCQPRKLTALYHLKQLEHVLLLMWRSHIMVILMHNSTSSWTIT